MAADQKVTDGYFHLTGKYRFRSHVPRIGSPLVVLQVQFINNMREPSPIPEWRDATVGDLTCLSHVLTGEEP